MTDCVVCGNPADSVRSSMAARGSSNAYCLDCASKDLESYEDIVTLLFCAGPIEEIIPEMHPMIYDSLSYAGKTLEEAQKEADLIMVDYIKSMEEEAIGECGRCGAKLFDEYQDCSCTEFVDDEDLEF